MPMTKAQIDLALELFERFVEAHETLAEVSTNIGTPTVNIGAVNAPTPPAEAISDNEEVASTGDTEDNASDPFGLGEPTPPASDEPVEGELLDDETATELDLTDKDAVKEFRTAVGALIREYGSAVSPEAALDLIEETTETRKFSQVPDDMLTTLHDTVYDALNENG